jgi:hypothetical protein
MRQGNDHLDQTLDSHRYTDTIEDEPMKVKKADIFLE